MDIFREKDVKWVKEFGDNALDFEEIIPGVGGKIAEAGDGLLLGLTVNKINKWLSPKVPDDVKIELHEVFDGVVSENYEAALVNLADVASAILENVNLDEKYKPWIMAVLELYKGIIGQLVD